MGTWHKEMYQGKLVGVYTNISYRFIFPDKGVNNRRYETITWFYSLDLILEMKYISIDEVAPPVEA